MESEHNDVAGGRTVGIYKNRYSLRKRYYVYHAASISSERTYPVGYRTLKRILLLVLTVV